MSIVGRILVRAAGIRPAETRDLAAERGVRVPAPDGTSLATDVHLPRTGGRRPTVLMRSPYGRAGLWSALAIAFAERGYNAVLQSCRGTFGSGGDIDFAREAGDGRAAADWIVQQGWSDGTVGTFGPSYLSFVQWALASTRPPQLKAMAIHIMASDRRQSYYPGGSFALDNALTWCYLVSNQEGGRLAGLRSMLRQRQALEPAFHHLPLRDADVVALGKEVPYYREWLEHDAPEDPYWEPVQFSGTIPVLGIPVSFVGGWYDYYLPYLLEDHAALRRAGVRTQLVVGPWAHSSFASLAAGLRHGLDWLDMHLLGRTDGQHEAAVRLAIMGTGGRREEWRELADWPPTSERARWYLHPSGRLAVDPPPATADPDHYRYDPADPTPAVGGTSLSRNSGPRDNRALEARADVLTYTSEPLASGMEIAGPVAAELYVSSSLEHTDFFARLCDVAPGGRSTNVCDGLLRLRPSDPPRSADGPACVRIELWPTAYRFGRGHRVRLQVSSGAHPRFARNPGSGEPLATATALVAADQAVWHDTARPSAVVLPVTAGEPASER